MSEIVDVFDFRKGLGRKEAYPWDDWADGQVRKLTRGVDFRAEVSSFQNAAYAWARRHDLVAATRIVGIDQVMLQMNPKPVAPTTRRTQAK